MKRRDKHRDPQRIKPRDRAIVGGVDESYYDDEDDFWRPIREADERDQAAHESEVKATLDRFANSISANTS